MFIILTILFPIIAGILASCVKADSYRSLCARYGVISAVTARTATVTTVLSPELSVGAVVLARRARRKA